MSFYRSIILLALTLVCTYCSVAQDNSYVYKDTALLYADSVEAAVKAAEESSMEEDEDEEVYEVDTSLHNNQLSVELDSIVKLKESKPFAYAKNLDSLLYAYQKTMKQKRVPEKNELSWLERFFLSPITKYFFWGLAAFFVSFILYKLFFTQGFFQLSYAKLSNAVLTDEKDELPNNADYEKLIARAAGNSNYRMAVRYHYLQSLQKLSLKGAIKLTADKTNYEYLNELSGKSYKKAFASLTLHYEYVWYGEFQIDKDLYNTIQNKFRQFNSEV
ncbi:MAG: hypothetical protein ABIN01_07610 [Ferruginibacter sp.]